MTSDSKSTKNSKKSVFLTLAIKFIHIISLDSGENEHNAAYGSIALNLSHKIVYPPSSYCVFACKAYEESFISYIMCAMIVTHFVQIYADDMHLHCSSNGSRSVYPVACH